MPALGGLNHGCVVAVFLQRSLPVLALILFLGGAAGQHTVGDDVRSGIFDPKTNMVRGELRRFDTLPYFY